MKKYWSLGAAALLALTLAACNSGDEPKETNAESEKKVETSANENAAADTEKVISYLDTDYTFPNPVENIVAASLEAMEDAAALGVKPVGVLEIAGEIPKYLAEDLAGAALIGDKMKPNAEAILNLEPDAIIGTSKWNEDTLSQMNKIATTLPYSHISTNWKDNLLAFSQLVDKEAEAEKIIADYEKKAADAKIALGKAAADQEVLIIRVRGGVMNIYPAGVYLNPVLYEDLGLQVPAVLKEAEAQAELTLETLAEIDPDMIFLQFETSENTDAPNALKDLEANPIFANLTASKNGEVHVNTVAPLAQGGTAWSKVKFLDAAVEKLVK
ncbi:ABC transporter substrate-binding protein [Lysinibacillus odysseyi]|uniref:Iron-uptake system-binding protein n=1 Tax=Lysinibacillus odysseyi 34hs-1 = NBRC 100172 TaxID=1220589 RepID=A0A0A3IM99_9BACI|nr:ABC transporter substrate-binding protein [Lysinibacillus odysseyi]KGR85856.1 iron-uptake system-binding protein [Lysinibacillus odysseyi 34hs-1 = NBRC 100172]